MSLSVAVSSVPDRAMEVLRRAGNPFRNYFARNPDDDVCTRYHVPELFATERRQLLGVVDLYRQEPRTHSEIVPILGNKGSGKTHLLHSIKHGDDEARQLLVTPGIYHKDTDFLEYLLFQIIDTLLGGGKQSGNRPIEFVGEELCRRLMRQALEQSTPSQRLELFPAPGLGRWARRLGLGASQAHERTQWILDHLGQPNGARRAEATVTRLCAEAGIEPDRACALVCEYLARTLAHDTAGLMRRHIFEGFARACLLSDEADLAEFLTYGFAELDFQVRPTRQDLVLALLKVLMDSFLGLRIPVVVAFDQLEDLLLSRRTENGHNIAEAFFAGIVQAMHQVDGICFLVFAERGLWNRFVPSLDGYIQDRLNNPIHLPEHGTIKTLRLEAPSPDLVRRIVEARLRPALEELPESTELPSIFPFTDEPIERIARTEPTLRDMLQQFRHLFDHLVFGRAANALTDAGSRISRHDSSEHWQDDSAQTGIKSVIVVEHPADDIKGQVPTGQPLSITTQPSTIGTQHSGFSTHSSLSDSWKEEIGAARAQLEPAGAITGATRELQAGLGKFLDVCHEHGVKVGPWRLHHVTREWTFGEHPTYGVMTVAHWVCKDGQPWKVGIGLFLGRGPGKPKDLEIKLGALEAVPPVIDHLILLRPGDDLALSGKSKALWQESERRGRHARLEPLTLESFGAIYAFPRWLAGLTEAQPEGQPVPNLARFLQEKCEKLLEQLCMPVQQ